MRIIAIASGGGHWVQLLRLKPAFESHETIYISTKQSFGDMVKGSEYYAVPDANRWSKIKLLSMSFFIFKLIKSLRPSVIITTGAAPGLVAIACGRILGIKTVWVDSVANVETLSLSGKIAKLFANRIYTQWPDLEAGKIIYEGSVLS